MVAPVCPSVPAASVAADEAAGGAGKGAVDPAAGDGAAGCVPTEGSAPAAPVLNASVEAGGVAKGSATDVGGSVCVAGDEVAGRTIAATVGGSVSDAPARDRGTVAAACGEVSGRSATATGVAPAVTTADAGTPAGRNAVAAVTAAPACGFASVLVALGTAASSENTMGRTVKLDSPGRRPGGEDALGKAVETAPTG